jgi:hypothetical protein
MGSHDPELQRLLVVVHVFVALRQHRPRRSGAGLNANDFLHNTDSFTQVVVNVRLIAIPYQGADLLGERRTTLAAFHKD